jgi:hypothetical protein
MTGAGKPHAEVGLLRLAAVVSVALPTENHNSPLSAADAVKERVTLTNLSTYACLQIMDMTQIIDLKYI